MKNKPKTHQNTQNQHKTNTKHIKNQKETKKTKNSQFKSKNKAKKRGAQLQHNLQPVGEFILISKKFFFFHSIHTHLLLKSTQ